MSNNKLPDDTHEKVSAIMWDAFDAVTNTCPVYAIMPTEWTAVDQATEREGTVEQALEDAFDFGGVFDG